MENSKRYDKEYVGGGVQKAYEDIQRLSTYKVGYLQRRILMEKKRAAAAIVSGPTTPDDPIDSLLVTLKTSDTLHAINLIKHRIRPDSCVTLLQNGMGIYEELCQHVWPDRMERPQFVLGSTTHGAKTKSIKYNNNHSRSIVHSGLGTCSFGIVPDPRGEMDFDTLLFPDLERTRTPRIPLPPLSPRGSTSGQQLQQTLNVLLSLEPLQPSLLPIRSMYETLLLKLAINASINPLTAIYGIPNGSLLRSEPCERMRMRITEETSRVILAYLVSISPEITSRTEILDTPDKHPPVLSPRTALLFSPKSLLARTKEVLIATGSNISSMNSHIRGGKLTEIEAINGYLCRLGERVGVKTPINEMMVDLVKGKNKAVLDLKRVREVAAERRRVERLAKREKARLDAVEKERAADREITMREGKIRRALKHQLKREMKAKEQAVLDLEKDGTVGVETDDLVKTTNESSSS
jgi:2-dehydropantoate 2-reductase